MRTKFYNLLLFVALVGVTVTSCTKDDSSGTNDSAAVNTAPSFGDAGGTMVAIKTTSYVSAAGMEIPTELNSAVVAFYDSPGSQQFTDAGNVSINSLALKKNDNNSYTYIDYLNPLSLSQIKWEVVGNGTIPAISKTVTQPMPSFTGYSSLPASITKADGFTVNFSGKLSGADSLYVFVLDAKSKSVLKRAGGNASSVVFSATDLSVLQTGTGMLMVAPYNYTSQVFSGKKVYFVNESVYTKVNVAIN